MLLPFLLTSKALGQDAALVYGELAAEFAQLDAKEAKGKAKQD